MAGLELATAVVDEVHHVGREAKSIAKLLDKHAYVDDGKVGQHVAHVDIYQVGQRDGEYHGPQPALQAVPAHAQSAEYASQGESYHAHRALHQSILLRRESQAAIALVVYQEECSHLGQQTFGHAIEEHEEYACHHLLLAEECPDGVRQLAHNLLRRIGGVCLVRLGPGQHIAMPQPEADKQAGDAIEHQTPREGDAVAVDYLQIAGYHHQHTLAEDGGQAVERGAYAHIECLVVGRQFEHVETIGGDVVGGAREGHHPEEEQGALQPEVGRDGECHAAKGCAHQQLHGDYPPSFGFYQVNKWTPEWLEHPREIQPTGVEGYLGIAQPHLLVHDDRDGHHGHIGQSFGKVQRRNPAPWRFAIVHIQCFSISS